MQDTEQVPKIEIVPVETKYVTIDEQGTEVVHEQTDIAVVTTEEDGHRKVKFVRKKLGNDTDDDTDIGMETDTETESKVHAASESAATDTEMETEDEIENDNGSRKSEIETLKAEIENVKGKLDGFVTIYERLREEVAEIRDAEYNDQASYHSVHGMRCMIEHLEKSNSENKSLVEQYCDIVELQQNKVEEHADDITELKKRADEHDVLYRTLTETLIELRKTIDANEKLNAVNINTLCREIEDLKNEIGNLIETDRFHENDPLNKILEKVELIENHLTGKK